MTKIIIDGKEVECRERVSVLQAALDGGWDVPHYCYHPGLAVVASCRLCLMEMKMPDPKTKEMAWSPRLVPSCQTPVKDGMEVRFDSDKVRDNQTHCMEYFLLNHPLDCPVCDQAGECYLQDYSLKFGHATSRMVEPKNKNPKKDIGSKTLLYQDRCVMCSRCVRFCDEVAGTGELCIVNRGSKSEIDVFPGIPLENKLQGNVVDICPVGSLLDKDFLMDQRVWFLKETKSVCPGCSTGCTIEVHHNEGKVWRLKPRWNPGVNDWWMCDEGRFGWKYVHDPKRINRLRVRRGAETEMPDWSGLPEMARLRFEDVVAKDGGAKVAAMLSPFMSCEEAWLLGRFIRSVAPEAFLAMGPVPVAGEDEAFPKHRNGNGQASAEKDRAGDGPALIKFTIRGEKCPNRRGVERVLKSLGGATGTIEEFVKRAGAGEIAGAWIVGGFPGNAETSKSRNVETGEGNREQGTGNRAGASWVTKELAGVLAKIRMIFAQDLFDNEVTAAAAVVIPSCAFAERSGCFENALGKIQAFDAAIPPPEGCQRDGQYLYAVSGGVGLYQAARVREQMAATMPEFAALHVAPEVPEFAH